MRDWPTFQSRRPWSWCSKVGVSVLPDLNGCKGQDQGWEREQVALILGQAEAADVQAGRGQGTGDVGTETRERKKEEHPVGAMSLEGNEGCALGLGPPWMQEMSQSSLGNFVRKGGSG